MKILEYNKYGSVWPLVKRHWGSTWPYLNFTKSVNILRSKINEITGRENINSRPYFIKIEPTNRCMLHCSGCLHAADGTSADGLSLSDMNFDLFKKIIEQLENYLVKVSLYSEGEPLIYQHIARMVKFLTDKNIASVISSNFNYLTPDLARALVASRLTHLIVCLDGYDENSYKRYRSGGDFNRVLDNIKLIQAVKREQASKLPLLEIQTIDLPYFTRVDLNRIKKIAVDLGADNFSIKKDLTAVYKSHSPAEKRCFWLYSSPQFKVDGRLQPCCYYYDNIGNDFGNADTDEIAAIWNNEKYTSARKYFRTGQKGGADLCCYHCDFFKKNYVNQ